jgi:chemotaxis response regulator CheB
MSVNAVVVDDSATARQLISYHLHKAGCTLVGEATNAADALTLLRELNPDIVTVDLMMPNKDDLDSMALVRAIKKEMPAARSGDAGAGIDMHGMIVAREIYLACSDVAL